MLNDFSRYTADYHIGRDIFCHYGSCGDDGIITYRHSRRYHGICTYPHSLSYVDRLMVQILPASGIMVMIQSCQHDAMPYQTAVADIDAALVLKLTA